MSWRHLAPLGLFVAGIAAYHNSFSVPFLLDDLPSIAGNDQIRCLEPIWKFFVGTTRPVVEFSLALNYTWGGLDVWGYHAFNLGVHLLTSSVLLGVVRRTLKRPSLSARYGRHADSLAFVVALLWLVHPLQTQAVTYIIQRAESMMGLFYLSTLYCTLRAAEEPTAPKWFFFSIFSCALGMGSKAVMVTAPVAVLLYDRIFLASSWKELFRRRRMLHLGLMSTCFLLGEILLFEWLAVGPDRYWVASGVASEGVSPWRYALTQTGVLLHYLRLSFWPDPLVFLYHWPPAGSLQDVLWPSVSVAVLGGTVLWILRRRPGIGFLGLWFFLILAPTSSLIPIRHPIFEHRMYLPLAAVVTAAVLGADAFFRFFFPLRERLRNGMGLGLALVLAMVLGVRTVSRNEDYRSAASLWSDTLRKGSDNPPAHNGLGVAYLEMGEFEKALRAFSEAIRQDSHYAPPHGGSGIAFHHLGRYEEAIEAYGEAIRLRPEHPSAYTNYAFALQALGKDEEAFQFYQKALVRNPYDWVIHNNLGNLFFHRGQDGQAGFHYREAIRLDPHNAMAHGNLGAVLHRMGKREAALAFYQKALELDLDLTAVRKNLDLLLQGEVEPQEGASLRTHGPSVNVD